MYKIIKLIMNIIVMSHNCHNVYNFFNLQGSRITSPVELGPQRTWACIN